MAIIKEIEDFEIPGGAGSKIETCYVADSWDDFREFVEDLYSSIYGYVEEGDKYTLAWHEGYFFDIYTCPHETIRQDNMDEEKFKNIDLDEMDEEEVEELVRKCAQESGDWSFGACVWYQEVEDEEGDIYYFGIVRWY